MAVDSATGQGKTPLPHQLEIVRLSEVTNPLAIHDCGLGKTYTGILTAYNTAAKVNRPILIVTSKLQRWYWEQEIRDAFPDANTHVLDKKAGGRVSEPIWVITHYEHLQRCGKVLENTLWGCVVADEVHRIKNREAERTLALKKIVGLRHVGLTATPVSVRVSDYWSICNWLHPQLFGRGGWSYWKFFRHFTETEDNWFGRKEIVGLKNEDELAELLAPFARVKRREDTEGQFPSIVETVVPLEMYKEQKTAYKSLRKKKEMFPEVEGLDNPVFIRNQLIRLLRLQQMATDPGLFGLDQPSVKLDWCKQFVEDNPGEQILFFTRFKEAALNLAETLQSAVLAGDRDFKLREFVAGAEQVCVSTIGKGGEGLDLPNVSTCVFIDCDWSPIKMQQARGRIDRMGNTKSKRIIYLHIKGTVDDLIQQSLLKAWNDREIVLNALSGVLAD